MNLAHNVSISRSLNAVAAGTSVQNGTAVDMQGWDGVVFILAVGTLTATAVTALKGQQGNASDGSDGADLLGTSVPLADTASNKLAVLDIYRPQKRYVRPVVSRGTANAVIDSVIAIRYRGRKAPITLDSTVAAAEYHQSPIEGTA